MKSILLNKVIYILFFLLLPLGFSCSKEGNERQTDADLKGRDLAEIRDDGKLIVVTDFSSVNYFIYRGKPMGFQYELLQELSDYLDIEVEVTVSNDLNRNFISLVNGDVDIIASNLTITEERKKLFNFVLPHNETRQVLVQKTKSNYKSFSESGFIEDISELSGKNVYVQKNSSHASLLKNLVQEKGLLIRIHEVPIETEQLVRMVSKGEIEYTIADEDIATVNKRQLKGIDIETVLSYPEEQAWAVRKDSDELTREINNWMESFSKTRRYAILHNKYFMAKSTGAMYNSNYNYSESGRISPYDEIFKSEAEKIGWDWRLIASMVYQESRFNPGARSWAGAFGLMQLMPRTAERFGVNQYSPARDQIRAGIHFIKWLDNRFKNQIKNPEERQKFVLASYNVGPGHVTDAMKLAEKYGMNPYIWEDNVETWLLNKSDPKYFSDPVVVHGYARGTETSKYVKEILYRYNHYLNHEVNTELAQVLQ
jgi:membrane-bound lytic murein transglycosylase F